MKLSQHQLTLGVVWTCILLLSDSAVCAAEPPLTIDFHKQVLPLLLERCSKCHSEEIRIAGLTVTTLAGLRKGSQNGPVIIPKQAEDSLLYKRLKQEQMPPGGEGKIFDAQELDLIRRWIQQGGWDS